MGVVGLSVSLQRWSLVPQAAVPALTPPLNTHSSWFVRPFTATKRLSCLQISSLRWREKVWPYLPYLPYRRRGNLLQTNPNPSDVTRSIQGWEALCARGKDSKLSKTYLKKGRKMYMFLFLNLFSNKANHAKLILLIYFFCFWEWSWIIQWKGSRGLKIMDPVQEENKWK